MSQIENEYFMRQQEKRNEKYMKEITLKYNVWINPLEWVRTVETM